MNNIIIFGAKYLFAVVLVGSALPLTFLDRRGRISYIVTATISGVLAFGFTKLAGIAYFDPRPFTHGVHSLIPHEADNGFPSDHTVLAFTAALLTLKTSKPLCIGLVLFAAIVGVCRVLAGIHSPLDVIVGVVLGVVSVAIGAWFTSLYFDRKSSWSTKI